MHKQCNRRLLQENQRWAFSSIIDGHRALPHFGGLNVIAMSPFLLLFYFSPFCLTECSSRGFLIEIGSRALHCAGTRQAAWRTCLLPGSEPRRGRSMLMLHSRAGHPAVPGHPEGLKMAWGPGCFGIPGKTSLRRTWSIPQVARERHRVSAEK